MGYKKQERVDYIRKKDGNHMVFVADGYPWVLRVIKSGWANSYFVIMEFGDMDQAKMESFLSKEQVEKKFNIKLD